ncbi:unnamed protein product [Mytilus coruscus]|uniref:Uncharacterized protein n=1 Tax=Mytilus coruscus TaxID=42192 RepID=A0A6J8AVH9_MYTCO|nr:unnamed protein product [Mytilus coruscus]
MASLLYVSYKPDGISVFFDQWNKSRELAFTYFRIKTNERKTKLKVKAFLIATLITLASNVVTVGVILFVDLGSASETILLVYSTPFKLTITVKVCAFLLCIIDIIAWIFPVIFFVLLCFTLKDDFETYNSFLTKQAIDSNGKIGKDITQLRLVHLELCTVKLSAVWIAQSVGFCLLGLY